jgi:hypothetical protein
MKRHLAIYVENEEFAQLKQEAARRKISLSRHVKERLLGSRAGAAEPSAESAEFWLQAAEQRFVKAAATAAEHGGRGLAENLRTVIVMLDQLVRSTLTHLPEIPEAHKERALAAGERRHRAWQQEVEALLRQMRAQPAAERRPNANGNGAHA